MRVFLDTNVILDFLFNRIGAQHAITILRLSKYGEINALFSDLSVANCAYITRKHRDVFLTEMPKLINILEIVSVGSEAVKNAFQQHWTDFEDCLQYQSAKLASADYIVTNNTNHFILSDITVFTPAEFLQFLQQKFM